MMEATGKWKDMPFRGGTMRLYNQRCKAWTHPYEYPPAPGGVLSSSGCGIFSTAHVAWYMSGTDVAIEELADFSVANGGRGDDGTDRPMLLAALSKAGIAREYGFSYDDDGLRNDHEALWRTMLEGGCALANLRVGHIVALLDYRVSESGERQLLVADCYSESAQEKVRPYVRECVPGSEIVANVFNEDGVLVGQTLQYAMYWTPLTLAKDFNLLHPLASRSGAVHA